MSIFEVIITIFSYLVIGFIGYRFAKETEKYKFELLKIKQVAKVAELFAFWLRCDDEVLNKFTEQERVNHCEKLNRITWELAIWIPDEKIVKDIMGKLSHNPQSQQDIKKIILNIREKFQGKKSKELKWEDIVNFK